MAPLSLLLAAVLVAAAPSPGGGGGRTLPVLKGMSLPRAAGVLRQRGLGLSPSDESAAPKPAATWQAFVASGEGSLLVEVVVEDPAPQPTSALLMTLHFPDAGATAGGRTYRFGPEGKRASGPEDSTPSFAQEAVEAQVVPSATGFTLVAKLPVLAWPRFPASGEARMDLCLRYDERSKGSTSTNCPSGAMIGGALQWPAAARAGLGFKPPPGIDGLEARPLAWLGFGPLHSVAWISAKSTISLELLKKLYGDAWVDPASVGLFLPAQLLVHSGEELLPVLTGKDPFAVAGGCQGDRELRLALFLLKGKTAKQVLDWPASTCALGRATSVELNEQEALTIGYSTGATVSFTWSRDHFERTEIGERSP